MNSSLVATHDSPLTTHAPVRAELMLPWQLRAAMATRPVVYVPLGTLEWHCEHLPIGLDALTAHGLCLGAARADGGVVLPPLHYGTGGGHGAYPWTIMMVTGAEITAQLTTTLARLEDFGCRLAVLFSGHFADTQLAMIDHLATEWNARGQPLKVLATAVNRVEGLAIPPDHAGVFETSLLHALYPDLVQLDRLPSLVAAPLADDDVWEAGRHDPAHPIWGVVGPDPRRFDRQASAPLLKASVDWLVAKVRKTGAWPLDPTKD
jgi:creatinine amidohydrolase